MANIHFKVEENIPGPYFVDNDCIACDNCAYIAPRHFKLTPNNSHAFVYYQPKTDSEKKQCFKALKACPVFSIGLSS